MISCLPALPDPVEDGWVAEDDGDTGQHEPENEEELLWWAALGVPVIQKSSCNMKELANKRTNWTVNKSIDFSYFFRTLPLEENVEEELFFWCWLGVFIAGKLWIRMRAVYTVYMDESSVSKN